MLKEKRDREKAHSEREREKWNTGTTALKKFSSSCNARFISLDDTFKFSNDGSTLASFQHMHNISFHSFIILRVALVCLIVNKTISLGVDHR